MSRELPAFRLDDLHERRTRYCVCVFVLDEGERIRRQLARMQPLAGLADLIVADGGSTDGSLELTELRTLGVRALLTKEGPGGLSAQLRMALAWALDEGYEGVVVVDGNDKDDPAALPRFLAALDAGYDHVQGSRFAAGGAAVRTPLARLLGLRLVHAPAISLAAGFRYSDTTNGFRAYSSRLLLDPRVAPFRSVFKAYELHYYLAVRAPRVGYRTIEVPVTRSYPVHGRTPTKISPLRGNLRILGTLLRACLHRFDPPLADAR